ncbi:hypothetical protein AGMMS50225_19340 [Betaproteobacteria bacterium]|nr:hypothetical protein AGMMS50225_19340 [Betaproteobacteria bacterium]
MGTEITLEVGKLTLDWSKNSRGVDHGVLFQERDRKRHPSDQLDYEYIAENNEDVGDAEMAFVRSLRDVVPRLELLGFTLQRAEREYTNRVDAWREEYQWESENEDKSTPDIMNFDEFKSFATKHSLKDLSSDYIDYDTPNRDELARGRFNSDSETQRLPSSSQWDNYYSETSYFGQMINILHPYSILRILAVNTDNLAVDVVWQYGPLIESGWASEAEFTPNARRTQTFLIATEGNSDVRILEHAFKLLRPEIADFFRFIDMSSGYPFTGASNLVQFAKGLATIDLLNQVVVLFDNDAAGFRAYKQLLKHTLPLNIRVMMLPELDEFHAFRTKGPQGETYADINRRAAAIECYLDTSNGEPLVVWTSYMEDLKIYQGALDKKEEYTNAFMQQTLETVSAGSYDLKKLNAVLDSLSTECISMAMGIHQERC